MSGLAHGSIDCDVHVLPTIDSLMPHLPAAWQTMLRHVRFTQPRGLGHTYPAALASLQVGTTLEDLRSDVLAQSDLAILNAYYGIESLTHPYQAEALATAVNDWLRAQWLDEEARLLGSIAVAAQNTDAAVREIERVGEDPRFVQVLLPARADAPYGDHRYWPIWKAAAERGLALGIAFGGSTTTAPTAVGWTSNPVESYVAMGQAFQVHITSLIASGIFSEYPDLKVAVIESGWTWLPGLLWRMDREWKSMQLEVPWVTEPPSAYVRRHMRFTIQPTDAPPSEEELRQIVDHVGGARMLLYASDHPHTYAASPDQTLEILTDEDRRHVYRDNAWEFYRLAQRSMVPTGAENP